MGTKWGSVNVKCPFYITDGERDTVCEGVIDKTRCAVRFRSKKRKSTYMKEKCCEDYEECPLYISLMRKYGN